MHQLLLKGKFIGNIKGVLFDKDGTLSNSESHLSKLASARVNASLEIFSELNSTQKELAYLQELLNSLYGISKAGLNPKSLLAIASKEQNLISTATVFALLGKDWATAISLANEVFLNADCKNQFTANNKVATTRPILDGAKDFLFSLKKAKVKSSLITNDSMISTKEFIQINNFDKVFNYLWTAEDRPSKPDPGVVSKVCSLMKLNPIECALISDADTDLRMAKNAKIGIVLGFTGGWKIRPDLHQGNFLINNWNELEIHQTT